MRFSPFPSAALLKVPESVGGDCGAQMCKAAAALYAARRLLEALLGHLDPLRFAVLTFSLSWLQLRASVGDR